jgi:hypothetical protein
VLVSVKPVYINNPKMKTRIAAHGIEANTRLAGHLFVIRGFPLIRERTKNTVQNKDLRQV